MSKTNIAIVGGGIAGLATAYYLQKYANEAGLDCDYTLLEQSDRWGGKIYTESVGVEEGVDWSANEFVVEGGPDSFITQKPWALQLARELRMDERLLPTNDAQRKTYVLNKARPVPLPDGVLMIVPTKFAPFALSSLISPLGKLRMGFDLFIPPKRDGEDETLAQFIRRRLGNEALDKIAEPLMSGIYNAEAEMQSLLATFPRFRMIEEKHGSLIKGMIASRKAAASRPRPSTNGHKPASVFTSFRTGMHEFVTEIQDQLTGDLRLETAVSHITPLPGQRYQLQLGDDEFLQADTVVLAVPAYIAAKLVDKMSARAAESLNQIRYVSTGTISLAFRRDEVEKLDGFGVVIPRSENRSINAITWTSTKFDERAPAGYELLRVFFGGSRTPEMMDVADGELLATVRRELREILGITADPVFHRIYRWHRANPQYDVGHLDRVDAIEATLPEGLFVTGSPYRGIGIPDCVHQGQQTAQQVVARIGTQMKAALPITAD